MIQRSPIAEMPTPTVGEWVPIAATEKHELCDVLKVDGVNVGHIEGFAGGRSVYAYIFGHRLGSYGTVTGARLDVEECAVRAMPLIRWLAVREFLA